MAEVAKSTTFSEPEDRGVDSLQPVQLFSSANTSVDYIRCIAPCDGKLVRAEIQAAVTSDATATYTIVITNTSTSKTMNGTTLYDADPVLTAGTAASITLSTTAANVAVTRGDLITVAHTGGTGSGDVALVLWFDTQPG